MHRVKHPVHVEGCFGCKILGIQFGMVPGAYRQTHSDTYYDKDSLRDSGLSISEEEVRDRRADFAHHMRELDRETGL